MFYRKCGGYNIPLLEEHESLTDDYVNNHLQSAIKSDGCTVVSELYHECCVVHDLGYKFGIDPWGNPLERGQIDHNFRTCMESRSKLGRFQPVAWGRWLGVRVFGGLFRRRAD
jgi:hypothetical protein